MSTSGPVRLRGHAPWVVAIRKRLNKLLRRHNLRVVRRSHYQAAVAGSAALGVQVGYWAARAPTVTGWDCAGIVFSKDRPLQLHALLRSYLHQCAPAPRLDVLYQASTPAYQAAYEEVMAAFVGAAIGWHRERDFARDVRALITDASTHGLFFLVDDMVFIRPVDFSALAAYPLERYVPALRLGRNVTWSYFSNTARVQPALHEGPDGLFTWSFADPKGEWRPLSFDGDVYLRTEMQMMADQVAFHSPNSFELALTVFLPAFAHRQGVCFAYSRVVNIPLNRVQDEFANRCGNLHADLLLEHWQRGLSMDVEALYDARTNSVHAELRVRFAPRPASQYA